MQKSKKKIIIIPTGSYEYHGEHLPADTDSIIANYFANTICNLDSFFKLPPINYGCSYEHIDFPHTVSIKTLDYYKNIQSIVKTAIKTIKEVKLICLLNAHGGNTPILKTFSLDHNYRSKTKVMFLHIYTQEVIKYCEDLFGCFDTHAGSVETSLFSYINDVDSIKNLQNPQYIKKVSSGLNYFRNKEYSPTGVITDTDYIEFNKEKGKKLAKFILREINSEISCVIKKINQVYKHE